MLKLGGQPLPHVGVVLLIPPCVIVTVSKHSLGNSSLAVLFVGSPLGIGLGVIFPGGSNHEYLSSTTYSKPPVFQLYTAAKLFTVASNDTVWFTYPGSSAPAPASAILFPKSWLGQPPFCAPLVYSLLAIPNPLTLKNVLSVKGPLIALPPASWSSPLVYSPLTTPCTSLTSVGSSGCVIVYTSVTPLKLTTFCNEDFILTLIFTVAFNLRTE